MEGEGEGDRTLVEESEGTSPSPSRTPTPDEDIDEVRMMSHYITELLCTVAYLLTLLALALVFKSHRCPLHYGTHIRN